MDYSAEVRQRFAALARAGPMGNGAPHVVRGEAEDRSQNVWVRFEIQALEGEIRKIRFQAFGCPHTVAAASWAAERLEGRRVDDLGRLDVRTLRTALNVPVEKLGRLLLIEDALAACRKALGGEEKGR
jgi:NifU-like protein